MAAIRRPSDAVPNATDITVPVWPVRGAPIWVPASGSQMRAVLSAEPVAAIRRPSRAVPNATDPTELVWPVRGVPIWVPASGSQIRTVWSAEPEAAIRRPSRAVPNATDITTSVWPVRGGPMGVPASGSQMRMVLSLEPEAAIRRPSGAVSNATDLTKLVWPVRGVPIWVPASGSQIRTVQSQEPVAAIRRPHEGWVAALGGGWVWWVTRAVMSGWASTWLLSATTSSWDAPGRTIDAIMVCNGSLAAVTSPREASSRLRAIIVAWSNAPGGHSWISIPIPAPALVSCDASGVEACHINGKGQDCPSRPGPYVWRRVTVTPHQPLALTAPHPWFARRFRESLGGRCAHADVVAVIGAALLASAAGEGLHRIAGMLGVAESIEVMRWLLRTAAARLGQVVRTSGRLILRGCGRRPGSPAA